MKLKCPECGATVRFDKHGKRDVQRTQKMTCPVCSASYALEDGKQKKRETWQSKTVTKA